MYVTSNERMAVSSKSKEECYLSEGLGGERGRATEMTQLLSHGAVGALKGWR